MLFALCFVRFYSLQFYFCAFISILFAIISVQRYILRDRILFTAGGTRARLLVEFVDDFLFVAFLVLVVFALADPTTRAPDSVAADVLLSRPLELVKLSIQLGECPLRRRTFVEHGLELERGRLEPPENGVAGITNALERRFGRETGENRSGLGVDIAATSDESGGLR